MDVKIVTNIHGRSSYGAIVKCKSGVTIVTPLCIIDRNYIVMYSRKLCSTAYAAASARLFTPSFDRILET